MKVTLDPGPSSLPSAAVPTEIRLLSEIHAIQTTLANLTAVMMRISETLERMASARRLND